MSSNGAVEAHSPDPYNGSMDEERERPCPRCGISLASESASSHYGSRLEVDRCPSCGGIFTNWGRILALSPSIVEAWIEQLPERPGEALELAQRHLACPACRTPLEAVKGADLPAHLKVPADLELLLCARGDGFWIEARSLVEFKQAQTKNLERKRVDYQRQTEALRGRPRGAIAAGARDRARVARRAYSNAFAFLIFLLLSAALGTVLLTSYKP